MRDVLSDLIVSAAKEDERFIVLSGDHGYALFDAIRAERPKQFVNVGVAEQNMIGVAAGLAKVGYRPCVYGLAAFVPIRVLEQIKLDLCHANLPVMLLGDGAGLVYSTLGVSHQCGEDVACLRPLPAIAIYSPCDEFELRACWTEARDANYPCYIRIGKADRPVVHESGLRNTDPVWTHRRQHDTFERLVIATGSMTSIATATARAHDLPCLSVPRIKPLPTELSDTLQPYERIAVVEEHTAAGGIYSALCEALSATHTLRPRPQLLHFGLSSQFTAMAGSYDHALSEHSIDDASLQRRLLDWVKTSTHV